jgi:hypothetical protein
LLLRSLLDEVVDELGRAVVHLDVEASAAGQVSRTTRPDDQTERGLDERFRDTSRREPMPPEPEAAMPWKAEMTPTTVPSSPTNGAVEPMVAGR